jgi:ankyrin repeat protein
VSCASPGKRSKEELARRGLEFSEEAFLAQVRDGPSEAVRLFLRAGMSPDINDQGFSPLLEAARRARSETARALIESGAAVNAKDPYGVTALMFSLIAGSTDIALELINNGADINSRDVDGRTALVEALTSENEIPVEVIETLVRRGADVNVRLAGGLTPLMIAASGDSQVARILVEAGADMEAKDDRGIGVRERARDNPEVLRILGEERSALPAAAKKENP